MHESQQKRGRRSQWPLFRLRGGGDNRTNEEGGNKKCGSNNKFPAVDVELINQYIGGSNPEPFKDRPLGWAEEVQQSTWPRPLPLAEPRVPNLEFANETVEAVESEGGLEMTSPQKDLYRRSNAQIEAIKEARRDQRSVGGGIYQCHNKEMKDIFLTIHRPFAAKTIGIELEHVSANKKKKKIFRSFFTMKYEFVNISKISGERFRKSVPEETHTGFKWEGYGGDDCPLPSTCVYAVRERAGDRDLHFSAEGCGRLTEAPGASQSLCSNQGCGEVMWHFERKRFDKGSFTVTYKEDWVDDFSLVVFKDGTQKLVWRDESGGKTFWERLDSGPVYSKYKPLPDAVKMVEAIVGRGELPDHLFSDPFFVPLPGPWREQRPLRRQPEDSKW